MIKGVFSGRVSLFVVNKDNIEQTEVREKLEI